MVLTRTQLRAEQATELDVPSDVLPEPRPRPARGSHAPAHHPPRVTGSRVTVVAASWIAMILLGPLLVPSDNSRPALVLGQITFWLLVAAAFGLAARHPAGFGAAALAGGVVAGAALSCPFLGHPMTTGWALYTAGALGVLGVSAGAFARSSAGSPARPPVS